MGPEVFRTIRMEIGSVTCRGLEPKRIYMNYATYSALMSDAREFIRCTVVELCPPNLHERVKLYGVPIGICKELEDGEIDVSIKG